MKHSLRIKLIEMALVTVIIACFVMGINCIMVSRSVTKEDSEETLVLLNKNQSDRVNTTINMIEQSVDSLSNITISSISDFSKFKSDGKYVEECTKSLEVTTNNIAENTKGALCAYIRYNPEFTEPTSGIFISKSDDKFEFLEPTDFSIYDPSDLAHVGWYYIPVQAGEPIWMDPYMNENINKYMISYVVPIFIDNTSVGIVGMDVDFSEIEKIVADTKVYNTGYAYLISAQGNILSHKDYKTGRSMNEVLPDEYKIINDASNEGKVISCGDNCIIYMTLDNGMKLVLTVPEKEVLESTNTLTKKIIKMACFAIILAGVFAFFVSGTISKPIKKLTDIIRNTANLDFTNNIDDEKLMKRQDEIGVMANEITGMRNNLENMVKNIDSSCIELNASINHLQSSSEGVAEIAENNSAYTEELAAGVLESGNSIEKVQDNLNIINENANSIERLSKQGRELSAEIMNRAVDMRQSTKNASEKTRGMYESVKKEAEKALEKSRSVEKINELTGAISSISSQTSLLALNASIEAARAGEAGRGFSVVASEISNLAKQTGDTVASINEIVNEVSSAVIDMTKCLDQAIGFMGDTVLEDYQNFGKVSEQYKNDATIVDDNMESVNQAIISLSNNIAMIKEAMDNICSAVSEAGISINEIANSTSDMTGQIGENKNAVDNSMENIKALTKIVEQFQIN